MEIVRLYLFLAQADAKISNKTVPVADATCTLGREFALAQVQRVFQRAVLLGGQRVRHDATLRSARTHAGAIPTRLTVFVQHGFKFVLIRAIRVSLLFLHRLARPLRFALDQFANFRTLLHVAHDQINHRGARRDVALERDGHFQSVEQFGEGGGR